MIVLLSVYPIKETVEYRKTGQIRRGYARRRASGPRSSNSRIDRAGSGESWR
jgi:hypothetical protein